MSSSDLYFKKDHVYDIALPKSIVVWILNHITRPITGFEHKTDENGCMISNKEQLSETQFQMMLIAANYYKRGFSEHKIRKILSAYFMDTDSGESP